MEWKIIPPANGLSLNTGSGEVTYLIVCQSSKTKRRLSEFTHMRINCFKKESITASENHLPGAKVRRSEELILNSEEHPSDFSILSKAFSSWVDLSKWTLGKSFFLTIGHQRAVLKFRATSEGLSRNLRWNISSFPRVITLVTVALCQNSSCLLNTSIVEPIDTLRSGAPTIAFLETQSMCALGMQTSFSILRESGLLECSLTVSENSSSLRIFKNFALVCGHEEGPDFDCCGEFSWKQWLPTSCFRPVFSTVLSNFFEIVSSAD